MSLILLNRSYRSIATIGISCTKKTSSLRSTAYIYPTIQRCLFHHQRPLQLIYNTPPKKDSPHTSETEAATTTTTTQGKPVAAAKTNPEPTKTSARTQFHEKVDEAKSKVLTNKYYLMTPNILKPYVAGFLTRPLGFGLSFFILHEITAIVPLLTMWWLFIKFQWVPMNLPAEFLLKGTDIISSKLMDVSDSKLIYDKATIIMAGANAYAATKLMMPFRLPFSIALTPWFDRVVVQRIKKLFTRSKKNKKKN